MFLPQTNPYLKYQTALERHTIILKFTYIYIYVYVYVYIHTHTHIQSAHFSFGSFLIRLISDSGKLHVNLGSYSSVFQISKCKFDENNAPDLIFMVPELRNIIFELNLLKSYIIKYYTTKYIYIYIYIHIYMCVWI